MKMSESNLTELLKDIESVESDDTTLLEGLERGIHSKAFSFLQIVESLGILLSSKEIVKRKRGTKILSKCLSILSKNHLSENELEVLMTFYTDRVKDHHSLIPEILQGLYNLCDMQNLPQNCYLKLFPFVFIHFHCQAQMIHDRILFYEILLKSMNHNFQGLKPMGPDFVYGVIQSISGERDPRNLIFLFRIFIPTFLNKFELGHLNEEMFDVMACYFPVDFRPQSNDPDSISREDLSNALMPNLIAKQEFAEFCIPLALEKLESDLKVAKLDSLNLLINACYKFSTESISSNYKHIWNIVKTDMNTADMEIKSKTVELLHALLTKLENVEAEDLLRNVHNLLKYSFSEIDKKLYLSNVNVMVNISRDSKICMKLIAVLLVPILYTEVKNNRSTNFINILNEILQLCFENFNIVLFELDEISIDWEELLNLYLTQSYSNPMCWNAIKSFSLYLNDVQRKRVYDRLLEIILLNNTTSNEFENCLRTFGKNFKDEVYEYIVHPVQNQIQEKNKRDINDEDENMVDITENTDSNNKNPILEELYIKKIYCPLISLNTFLTELSSDVINFCFSSNSIESLENDSKIFLHSKHNFATKIYYLKYTIENNEKCPSTLSYLENTFNLVERIINSNNHPKKKDEIVKNEELIRNLVFILNILINSNNIINGKKYITLIEKCLTLFEKHDDDPTEIFLLIPLLSNIKFNSKETMEILSKQIKQLTEKLLHICLTTTDTQINKHSSLLLSVIVNSIEHIQSNDIVNLDAIENALQSVVYNDNIFVLHVCITKALLVKGHQNIYFWLNKLIKYLNDIKYSKNIIQVFKILIKEENYKIDYFQFQNVKFLYRQRLFMSTIDQILKNITDLNSLKNSSDEQMKQEKENQIENNISLKCLKLNNLLTIIVQLEYLPKQIIMSKIKTLLPIMIDCLTLLCTPDNPRLKGTNEKHEYSSIHAYTNGQLENDEFSSLTSNQLLKTFDNIDFDDVLNSLLNLFTEIFQTESDILDEYVNSFIFKLLLISHEHKSLSSRILALKCLFFISYWNIITILPYKHKVLDELKHCLDDSKRLVRKQAVQTIDRWYVLDTMQSEDE